MNEIAVALLIIALAAAGALVALGAILTALAREIARGASSVVGIAQAQLEASRGLHSPQEGTLEAEREAAEARDALQERSRGSRIDASALAEADPYHPGRARLDASLTPGAAVFGPYTPKRRPCGICAQLRGIFGWK